MWRVKVWKPTGNEGLNSVLRGKLNRLHRRTKGYSKSVTMLRDSIARPACAWA